MHLHIAADLVALISTAITPNKIIAVVIALIVIVGIVWYMRRAKGRGAG